MRSCEIKWMIIISKVKIEMKKVMYKGHVWKVGLYNKKTKIYWTIKGLIILFIKLQFSIKCNQAFRPFCTWTSNIYLKLNLNPNSLIIYIIPNIFVSLKYLMTPDVHITEVFIHLFKSDLGLHICQALRLLVYLLGGFRHSHYCFDVLEDQVNIRIREKS